MKSEVSKRGISLLSAHLRHVDKGVSVPSPVIPKQNRQVCSKGTCYNPMNPPYSSASVQMVCYPKYTCIGQMKKAICIGSMELYTWMI